MRKMIHRVPFGQNFAVPYAKLNEDVISALTEKHRSVFMFKQGLLTCKKKTVMTIKANECDILCALPTPNVLKNVKNGLAHINDYRYAGFFITHNFHAIKGFMEFLHDTPPKYVFMFQDRSMPCFIWQKKYEGITTYEVI